MSWIAVAKKDYWDAIRSRLIIGAAVMFVAFTGGGLALGQVLGVGSEDVIAFIIVVMIGSRLGVSTFVPLIALGVGYQSIVGERATGSLKLLLSLPNSRLDVVIGKFLGRAAVVGTAVLAGFISILVAAPIAFGGDFQVDVIVMFMLSTLLLAIVFVSIAVGISALSDSTFAAAVGAAGVFVLFQFAWRGVIELLRWAVNGFEHPGFGQPLPDWAEVVQVSNPMTAYQQATRWLVNRISDGGNGANGADAIYLEPWFGFVVLAAWIVLPLAVGFLSFEAADL